MGPDGHKVIFGMREALAAYANQGNHLIVDYILYKGDWIFHLAEALHRLNR